MNHCNILAGFLKSMLSWESGDVKVSWVSKLQKMKNSPLFEPFMWSLIFMWIFHSHGKCTETCVILSTQKRVSNARKICKSLENGCPRRWAGQAFSLEALSVNFFLLGNIQRTCKRAGSVYFIEHGRYTLANNCDIDVNFWGVWDQILHVCPFYPKEGNIWPSSKHPSTSSGKKCINNFYFTQRQNLQWPDTLSRICSHLLGGSKAQSTTLRSSRANLCHPASS